MNKPMTPEEFAALNLESMSNAELEALAEKLHADAVRADEEELKNRSEELAQWAQGNGKLP
jgi:hypothetical protein